MENNTELIISDKRKKIECLIFIGIIILSLVIMFVYMSKKEGWHCDEIFSYGSSNCYFENTLHPYGPKDSTRIFLETKVFTGGIKEVIQNYKYYYIDNRDEKEEIIDELSKNEIPTWRSREDAIDYVKAGDNRFNYASVYYNQLRDVHPPLFYMLVHTVSSVFNNTFSKYIIFFVSIPFFIGTCYFIRKILVLIDRRDISLIAVALYAFSMGAISTVMFQRMYVMLSFFTVVYLYLHLLIKNNNYDTTPKIRKLLILTTVLGFLTQYYFCIYALFIVIIMSILLIIKKKYKELFKYLRSIVISAFIGVLIFPFSISHIFFSYRGVSSFGNENYFDRLHEFIGFIIDGFSSNNMIALAMIVLIFFSYFIKRKNRLDLFSLLAIPVIAYVMVIAQIAPFIELRYIMNILPIMAMIFTILLSEMFENKVYNALIALVATVLISIYGLIMTKPLFLYEGYQEYIDISEEYSEDSLVFVGYTNFNHIQSIPEFMNYKQSLIISKEQLDLTKNNEVLEESSEFILIVNKYLGNEEVLNTIMSNTGYDHYEILKDDIVEGVDNIVYRIYR